jgi:23S rRNA (adenine-N6)-dimethyltransferase
VLAVELDPDWARRLLDRFAAADGVFVVQGDALRFPLPGEPFRVVANVPFKRTTDVLHRLLDDPQSGLVRADLVVQTEVARKRARDSGTVLSVSWAPWFEIRAGKRIPPSAFRPAPRVGAVVLTIRRREPLLDPADREAFAIFVRREFEQDSKRAARRQLDAWISGFRKPRTLP